MKAFKIAVVTLAAMALMTVTAVAAEDGAALYKTKCGSCHGATGAGDTTMGKKFGLKDLASGDVQKLKDDELTKIIKDGKGKMPAYKTLTDDQVKALVAQIRTFAKK